MNVMITPIERRDKLDNRPVRNNRPGSTSYK